jgi:hypothetical protein
MQGLKCFGFESALDLKALLMALIKGVAAAPSLLNWLQVSEGVTHQREDNTVQDTPFSQSQKLHCQIVRNFLMFYMNYCIFC